MIAAIAHRTWRVLVVLVAILAGLCLPAAIANGDPAAPTSDGHCLRAPLSPPKVLEASLSHPGDFKSQSALAEFLFNDVPAECQAHFRAEKPLFQFQLQDHLQRSRWIRLGPFRPAGLSPRHNDPPLWAHWGGSHGSANPIPQHLLYQCSPGAAVTRVRLLLKRVVVDIETHDVAKKTFTIPVKVLRVRARLKHHGALRGAC